MNKLQFDILCKLYETEEMDSDELSRELFKAPEQIIGSISSLEKEKMIQNRCVTQKGIEFLLKHKIDNAIILAAGMSTRFVPLSYEIPKGLLCVKGEILIERQIEQLRQKGIEEIIIVVGHMKEKFEYLVENYGVILVESADYQSRNNHSSIYAARNYLKNTIITSSDLYFSENIFQTYAFDSYYTSLYVSGKTAERGIETDKDDKIIQTFYGDKCYDIWITLGYAYFSKRFSDKYIEILEKEYNLPETANKFWADIQDSHLDELFMYAKRCKDNVIYEFDSLEELREFDEKYIDNSESQILKSICYRLAVSERNIIGLEALHKFKPTAFKFRCKGDTYICDILPDEKEKISLMGRMYYQCRDINDEEIKLFKMDKNVRVKGAYALDVDKELDELYTHSKDFKEYHNRALPLCAAENVISSFANLPLSYGFQERYIMNNTYSFNMEDNFIGCEQLFPFYEKIGVVCERMFGARYADPRPFTGMHCIDMIVKTLTDPGDKMMILSSRHGGHASVKPVIERLGVITYDAPYDIINNDLKYDEVNTMIAKENIKCILLAPSDLIKPLDVEKIDTTNCILLYDCSQLMGLIAAGLIVNPLRTMKNLVMFGGTHKTFPGPASGLILTNDKYLHDKMETNINPKYLRHSQMHQKISLLFSLIEFEQYGADYMSHMVHCSNYLGKQLRDIGYDVADINGSISSTHQIFIRCSREEMNTIYDNAYKCEVTLNKKHKELFLGYGIRLGTQEIARYDWNDEALEQIAQIISQLSNKISKVEPVKEAIKKLPGKMIHYTFPDEKINRFQELINL